MSHRPDARTLEVTAPQGALDLSAFIREVGLLRKHKTPDPADTGAFRATVGLVVGLTERTDKRGAAAR